MLLEGPLGTLLAVAIWTVCPCMTPESLAYLLHRLLHVGVKAAMRTRYPMPSSWIVVLVAAALLGGCAMPVRTFEPLVDDKHAVSDPEIWGDWLAHEHSGIYKLEVRSADEDAKEPKTYKVTF